MLDVGTHLVVVAGVAEVTNVAEVVEVAGMAKVVVVVVVSGVKPSYGRKMKCYNYGFDRHVMKEYKEACGICGSNSIIMSYGGIQNPRSC
jgi:hypothetical protein